MSSAGSTTSPPFTPVQLEHLEHHMASAGIHVTGRLGASPIAGGRSNLTVLLSDEASAWVLRMPPHAGRTPSAHDVAREHWVTKGLAGSGVPLADPVILCEDESVLGSTFAISRYVTGEVFRTQADLDALSDETLADVVHGLVSTLVALHLVDPSAVGLRSLGRPTGYAERQVRRWGKQWGLVGEPRLDALAHEVSTRLARRIPEQKTTSVVHGDYRIDNVLWDLGPPVGVAAVLDWELATLGDPVADVALMCAYRDPAFDLILGSPTAWTSARLPSVTELAESYLRAGGHELAGWSEHLAIAHFKIAVIAAGIAHRFKQGVGSGDGFASAGSAVEPFLEASLGILQAVKSP